jgi:anion-transporting  ArsA/GET3 family ATPase
VIVGGKGGVGRSTVATALALAGARQGRRTLVVELDGRSDAVRLLGGTPGPGLEETRLGGGLYHVSIERRATLRDYLDHEVPGPIPAGRLTRSRTFSLFLDATPGMNELLSIGKVWELASAPRRRTGSRAYDLVVLDGPASGQLMALLRAPRTFGTIARVGPVARQTRGIQSTLTDPAQTGVVVVTTPEQMAITEALALRSDLQESGVAVDHVVVNRTVAWPFSGEQERALAEARADDPALASVRWLRDRARAQRQQLGRLDDGLPGVPQTELPFLFGGLDSPAIEALAARLAEGNA